MAIASSVYRVSGTIEAPATSAPITSPTVLAPGVGEKIVSVAGNTGKPLTRPEWLVVGLMAAVVVLTYAITALIYDPGKEENWFKPAEGVTIFAIFYVLAQAIERILTPIARLVPTPAPKDTETQPPTQATSADAPTEGQPERVSFAGLTTRSIAFKQRAAAVERCAKTGQPASTAETEEAARAEAMRQAQNAANWHETLQQAYVNATTVWALGAAIAFVLCAWLDVYLLSAVAVTSWNPPYELDLLVTGLAIGGGTVPLHDLIGRIQKKDDKQASNTATSATPGGGRAGVNVTTGA